MKRLYSVVYLNYGKEVYDLLNTFNCICLLILARFKKGIKIKSISECDFYE